MHLRFIVIVSGALANVHLGPKEDLRGAAVRSIPSSRHRKTGAACLRRREPDASSVERSELAKIAPRTEGMALGAGAAMTEVRHVPLDRRGTPRTCYLVADKFGFANCQTVAPPALGDTQEGRAAASGWTSAAESRVFQRKSANAAATGRNNAVTTSRRLRTGRNTDRR